VTAGTTRPHDAAVIRDVVLHINNEQPLRADLFDLPDGDTVLLRCTNVRTLSGTKPIFVDDLNSIIFLPMLHLRFIEVLPASHASDHLALPAGEPSQTIEMGSGADDLDEELEIDEDFLRRIREA
jgi:hypothetical protein